MVIEYLEKIYQEMYERKVSLERDYKKTELLLKENAQFIDTLENSLDKNYESFSPRDINRESYEKIEALKEEKSIIEKDSEKLKERILNLTEHLVELEEVLQNLRESTRKEKEKEVLIEEEDKILLRDSMVQSLTGMIHKIELCTKLMDVDKVRCKLELQNMSKTMKKMIEDICQN